MAKTFDVEVRQEIKFTFSGQLSDQNCLKKPGKTKNQLLAEVTLLPLGVRGAPVGLQVLAQVLTGIGQLILVQDDVKGLWRAICQLFGDYHLSIHELCL